MPFPSIGGIACAWLPSRLLARLISIQRNPKRQATATTTPTTIPAIAPEARWEDDLEASGLFDWLDAGEDEDVVANAFDQQRGFPIWEMDIPWDEAVDGVLEILLRDVVDRLLEDVDEDSTALASAIVTFAFALAKFVSQTLIWFFVCVQRSYSWLQHHSKILSFSCDQVRGCDGTTYALLHSNMKSVLAPELPKSPQCNYCQNPSRNYKLSMMSALLSVHFGSQRAMRYDTHGSGAGQHHSMFASGA